MLNYRTLLISATWTTKSNELVEIIKLFLVSDEANWITGQIIHSEGGLGR